MTERQSESEGHKTPSFRRRVGKIALVLGVFLIVSLIVLGAFVSLAAAYTGDSALNQLYLDIAIPGLLLGFLLMIVGVTSVLLSEGFSKDWLWSMQFGPYLR
ncbi:MAG: hypothetical protein ACFFER_13610 [Candidatus Thorarchaeota archaeon]